jgi:ATP-binding protein involved in chromosome partitioning
MGRNNYLRVVGVIENMSAFVAPDGERHELFGRGGAEALAADIGAPLLGSIPIDPAVSSGGDHGRPAALGDSPAGKAFRALAKVIFTEAAPPVDMAGCSARMLAAAEKALNAAEA